MMTDETLENAIFRLDTAVSRAEAALAARLARVIPAAPDPDLAARHDALRADTEIAIARLDRLIGPEQP